MDATATENAILEVLVGQEGALTAPEVGRVLGINRQKALYHLQAMTAQGLVIPERRGRLVAFRPQPLFRDLKARATVKAQILSVARSFGGLVVTQDHPDTAETVALRCIRRLYAFPAISKDEALRPRP